MGREHELEVGVLVEIRNDNLLVLRPRTARHQHLPAAREAFSQRQGLGGVANVEHAVEARVAHHVHIRHAYAFEQSARGFVLHEQVRHAAQAASVAAAVRAEENLVFAEDARHAVAGNAALVEHLDVIAPKLVFDEKGSLRTSQFHEAPRVEGRVERQVAHEVGAVVILAHLVARGREKGEQYFLFGMLAAQTFHERAALLELAERGGVKPHVSVLAAESTEHLPRGAVSLHHFAQLLLEERSHPHAECH